MKHRYPRERQVFTWTAPRLALLQQQYMARNPFHTLSLTEISSAIADALAWPVEAVKKQLCSIQADQLLPTSALSIPCPEALLAAHPLAEAGPFLWEAHIDGIGRRRWALRYGYGTFPWSEGQMFAYQGHVYRVRRAWCSSLVLVLVQMEVQ